MPCRAADRSPPAVRARPSATSPQASRVVPRRAVHRASPVPWPARRGRPRAHHPTGTGRSRRAPRRAARGPGPRPSQVSRGRSPPMRWARPAGRAAISTPSRRHRSGTRSARRRSSSPRPAPTSTNVKSSGCPAHGPRRPRDGGLRPQRPLTSPRSGSARSALRGDERSRPRRTERSARPVPRGRTSSLSTVPIAVIRLPGHERRPTPPPRGGPLASPWAWSVPVGSELSWLRRWTGSATASSPCQPSPADRARERPCWSRRRTSSRRRRCSQRLTSSCSPFPDDVLPGLVAGLVATGSIRPGQFLVHTSGRYGVGVLEPRPVRRHFPSPCTPR